MGRGFLLSGLLHVTLVAMLYFGMSAASRLPPAEEAISIEVVAPEELGEAAPAPAPAETSPKPEREAASPAPPPPPPPPRPEPKPEPPAPPPAPPAPRAEPEPAAQEVAKLITEEMEPPPEPAPPPPPAPAPEAEPEPPPPPPAPVAEPEPPPAPEPEAAEAPPEPATPTPRLKPLQPKPEPKVAEAKPEPKPEPKAAKKPEPKPEPRPAEDTTLAQILRSVEDLNKRVQDDVARPGEGRAPPTGTPGQARNLEGQAATMSRSEVDALKRQIEGCWIVPRAVPGIEDMVVRLRISLQPDRRVRNVRVEDQGRVVTDPGYRAVAESAERAVLSCSPLQVPPDKYQLWREIVLTFTLRDILSG